MQKTTSHWLRKAEACILKGPRTSDQLKLKILGEKIAPVKVNIILGVHLDDNFTLKEHIKCTVERAEGKMRAMTRILPNLGGSEEEYCTKSTILYGGPFWQGVVAMKKQKNDVNRCTETCPSKNSL